ncbi:hypothetical protein GS438_16040 [Rhodococcus hoagii]|nr:hypothetical protein [Prescottella equi]
MIISAEPHDGNWLPMPPATRDIITRQYFYDWDAEDPYHLSIERIDVHGPGPVTEPVTVTAQVESVGRFVDGFAEYLGGDVQPARRRPQRAAHPAGGELVVRR